MPVGLVVLSRVVEAYPHTGRPAYRHSLFGPSHARCPLGSLYLMGLLLTYAYRSPEPEVSACTNLPSEASYHRAL
jgi:hypothetical protein